MTTAETIRQYHEIVEASCQAIADGTTGLSLPETGASPALAVTPGATTPEEVGPRHPVEHQADPKQQLFEQNVVELASVIQTEAGGVPNDEAKIAVGFAVLNRMRRNHVASVHQVWGGFAHGKTPSSIIYDLARRLLSGDLTDPTDGATHFYTPGAMPKEGGEIPLGSNTVGGLETVPGVTDEDGILLGTISQSTPKTNNLSR